MHARRPGSPRLFFVPTTLELEALRALGGFARERGLVETCGFGPVASAARAAQRIATLAPREVVLVGIAGSYDLDRAPVGSAHAFDAVSIEGVGAGSGACAIAPAELGFAHWRGADGRTIGDRIELAEHARARAGTRASSTQASLLLTVCAASASPSDARLRRERHPDALAEDMEGFGVATACAIACVPLSIVRGISNAAGDRDRGRWRVNDALRAARDLVEKTLDTGRRNEQVTQRLRIGISPCPNDTFAFHALLEREIEVPGLSLEFELADVEALNRSMLAGEKASADDGASAPPRQLDVAKMSFFAALALGERALVLPAGAAIGFGVGPLLLASRTPSVPGAPASGDPPIGRAIATDARVLCPGEWTTAHLLFRALHPGQGRIEHVRFDAILPALAAGEADFGVCIHEARFTWRRYGLELVEDLGASFEARTRAPIPLGGIVAHKSADRTQLALLTRAIRASIDHARAHPDRALRTMRKYAQESDDATLWAHVELYVDDRTRDLDAIGRHALDGLAEFARRSGMLPRAEPLEVLEVSDR